MTHFGTKKGQNGQKTQLKCANPRDISEESGDKMLQKILWGSPVIMNVKRDLREEEVQKYRIICIGTAHFQIELCHIKCVKNLVSQWFLWILW